VALSISLDARKWSYPLLCWLALEQAICHQLISLILILTKTIGRISAGIL